MHITKTIQERAAGWQLVVCFKFVPNCTQRMHCLKVDFVNDSEERKANVPL